MSARTKIAKSLQVGSYAPVVFQPSATGEHIKRAVGQLGLTGITINGIVSISPTEYPRVYTGVIDSIEIGHPIQARVYFHCTDAHAPAALGNSETYCSAALAPDFKPGEECAIIYGWNGSGYSYLPQKVV